MFAGTSRDDLTMETDADTGDVTLTFDGQVVAVLIDPGQFDLSNVALLWWAEQAAA